MRLESRTSRPLVLVAGTTLLLSTTTITKRPSSFVAEAWVPLLISPVDLAPGAMSAFQSPVAGVHSQLDLTTISTPTSSSSSSTMSHQLSDSIVAWYQNNLGVPAASAAETKAAPPTKEEISLLRNAFAAFYGAARDPEVSEKLLSEAIQAWQRQPADEQAGLYRVRGDCYMALLRPLDAISDYSKSLTLLDTPDGKNADPAELPAALLGRARAIRSLHTTATPEQRKMAVQDYEEALKLASREEWDTPQELLEDGARTNPYATWEYGMALRLQGEYDQAATIHMLAADYFDDIGDRARSVISSLDAGIDTASSSDPKKLEEAKSMLKEGIQKTKTVEGRDIPLLQRVIAKEGEGRMALASVAWTSGDRPEAEKQLGLACERLDQLEADAINRNKINAPPKLPPRLLFNIDDGVGALDISCTRLRNREYLTERLEWPSTLQEKVGKLYSLSK